MRSILFAMLLLPAVAHAQQLGVPLSSLPGVQSGVTAEVNGAMQGGVQGIALPAGTLNRLMMAPTGTGAGGGNVGAQIEQSFFSTGAAVSGAGSAAPGLTGGAATTLTAQPVTTPGRGVSASGVGVQLPTSQQLMPMNLIPGYQTMQGSGSTSPTGVGNLYTGFGQPRPGGAP